MKIIKAIQALFEGVHSSLSDAVRQSRVAEVKQMSPKLLAQHKIGQLKMMFPA